MIHLPSEVGAHRGSEQFLLLYFGHREKYKKIFVVFRIGGKGVKRIGSFGQNHKKITGS